jgi:hypothetical protein
MAGFVTWVTLPDNTVVEYLATFTETPKLPARIRRGPAHAGERPPVPEGSA